MGILFDLLNDIRKKKDEVSRLVASSDQKIEEINQQIMDLQEEAQSLREILPIQSLRRDLDAHYSEYLSNFLEVCIRNGGAGRCLVEMMPVPVFQGKMER